MAEKERESTSGGVGAGVHRCEGGGTIGTTDATEVSDVGATGAMVGEVRMCAMEAARGNEPRESVSGQNRRGDR